MNHNNVKAILTRLTSTGICRTGQEAIKDLMKEIGYVEPDEPKKPRMKRGQIWKNKYNEFCIITDENDSVYLKSGTILKLDENRSHGLRKKDLIFVAESMKEAIANNLIKNL